LSSHPDCSFSTPDAVQLVLDRMAKLGFKIVAVTSVEHRLVYTVFCPEDEFGELEVEKIDPELHPHKHEFTTPAEEAEAIGEDDEGVEKRQ
jgi:hypothetical protein